MENALIAVSTPETINIGDYVQALAAKQYLPNISRFIERERLDEYNGIPVKMIMNGYYMHEPEHWPPSPAIHPLFVSVHFNTLAKKALTSDKSIEYLRSYEPIGCRDIQTRDLLLEKGVKAYYSGCLTLTLGMNYRSEEKDDTVYIVDPCFENPKNGSDGIRNAVTLLGNFRDVTKIARKYYGGRRFGPRSLLAVARFYREYGKIFSRETLVDAEYIAQQSDTFKRICKTDLELLEKAEELVRLYSKAQLVITTRIHCALPCLGLETPVVFINNQLQSEASACRMQGLIELFNTVQWTGEKLICEFDELKNGLLSKKNKPKNKQSWIGYAQDLAQRCKSFCN